MEWFIVGATLGLITGWLLGWIGRGEEGCSRCRRPTQSQPPPERLALPAPAIAASVSRLDTDNRGPRAAMTQGGRP